MNTKPTPTVMPVLSQEVPRPPMANQAVTKQQLKSALWLAIGRLTDTTTLQLDKNATPQFIGALTELAWHQIASAAVDVESFARHAGRTVVDVEDVLLLARRNEALKGLLEGFVVEERERVVAIGEVEGDEDGGKKKKMPRGRPKGKAQKR